MIILYNKIRFVLTFKQVKQCYTFVCFLVFQTTSRNRTPYILMQLLSFVFSDFERKSIADTSSILFPTCTSPLSLKSVFLAPSSSTVEIFSKGKKEKEKEINHLFFLQLHIFISLPSFPFRPVLKIYNSRGLLRRMARKANCFEVQRVKMSWIYAFLPFSGQDGSICLSFFSLSLRKGTF